VGSFLARLPGMARFWKGILPPMFREFFERGFRSRSAGPP